MIPAPSRRTLLTAVHVPAGVLGLGQGAAAPVVALAARELGASVPVAGLVVALGALGLLLADLPAGAVVARWGERTAIAASGVVGAAGVTLSLLAPDVLWLAVGVLVTGAAGAVWGLARMTYLAAAVPPQARARVMSTMTAAMRVGFFVGPFLGGAVVLSLGPRGGFVVELVAVLVATVLMVRVPDLAVPPSAPGSRVVTVARANAALLASLGTGVALLGLARAARTAVVPLWAEHIGLGPAAASLAWGVANAVDVAASYPAGALMDRVGRRVVTVPAMGVLALGFCVLPLTGSPATFLAATVLLGLGNGMTNGSVMTLGADVAPASARAEFLASWRLLHDAGALAGPALVALVAAVAPLAAAGAVLAVGATAAGWTLWRTVPRYVPSRADRCRDVVTSAPTGSVPTGSVPTGGVPTTTDLTNGTVP
ncbi:putative MFS family arabinose efflux permease [Sediminihabitans luteus]|uniref:Putative MFS family arabinose efflux permease n=1 Tax=Sediminihabitans luteus TaxID=1138585 RepID=A0A2M9D0H3_9CELL|nr:MFS transporter [Sediminihabitans luteus]PJJ77694.1 putative MFS family arabinose efflux permease [Sediminihabitans luteus]GIJ00079.1 MFS transporter [Sediminihabitans luteus]